MSITYRDGELADAEAIAAMFAESFVDTFGHLYRPEDLAEFLSGVTAQAFVDELADDRFAFRLALDGARLAGFAKLGPAQLPVETPPDTIELYQLYVLPAWKGRGIAADLMDWALRAAAGRSARHVQLSVYVDNHRARRFYERFGFKPVGRYDFMVGSQADEDLVLRHVIMQADS
ncbi:MAG TPA: GNAT family N-acetyltransferase [Sphingomicrobium sp.]|nr:GNAT family N-acetyltransferase [Sphingomicrobium sp.]